jgi:hypothetical protein
MLYLLTKNYLGFGNPNENEAYACCTTWLCNSIYLTARHNMFHSVASAQVLTLVSMAD